MTDREYEDFLIDQLERVEKAERLLNDTKASLREIGAKSKRYQETRYRLELALLEVLHTKDALSAEIIAQWPKASTPAVAQK